MFPPKVKDTTINSKTTFDKLTKKSYEILKEDISETIQRSSSYGHFECTVYYSNFFNYESYIYIIIRILKDSGYKVKRKGGTFSPGKLVISWEHHRDNV